MDLKSRFGAWDCTNKEAIAFVEIRNAQALNGRPRQRKDGNFCFLNAVEFVFHERTSQADSASPGSSSAGRKARVLKGVLYPLEALRGQPLLVSMCIVVDVA